MDWETGNTTPSRLQEEALRRIYKLLKELDLQSCFSDAVISTRKG